MKYFLTVGLYKMGSYLDARAAALDLKSDYPEFRQVRPHPSLPASPAFPASLPASFDPSFYLHF